MGIRCTIQLEPQPRGTEIQICVGFEMHKDRSTHQNFRPLSRVQATRLGARVQTLSHRKNKKKEVPTVTKPFSILRTESQWRHMYLQLDANSNRMPNIEYNSTPYAASNYGGFPNAVFLMNISALQGSYFTACTLHTSATQITVCSFQA